jgi:hypothetical protein
VARRTLPCGNFCHPALRHSRGGRRDRHQFQEQRPQGSPWQKALTCYGNIGTPKNASNPYYQETSATADPLGYNRQGANYVDLGLGDFLYVAMGLPPGNTGTGNLGLTDDEEDDIVAFLQTLTDGYFTP